MNEFPNSRQSLSFEISEQTWDNKDIDWITLATQWDNIDFFQVHFREIMFCFCFQNGFLGFFWNVFGFQTYLRNASEGRRFFRHILERKSNQII